MADVAVITAIYGNYDGLKIPVRQVGLDVEWILVTDQKSLIADQDSLLRKSPLFKYFNAGESWRVVYEPRPEEIPVRAAKWPKLLPWEYTDAPASIWIDSSCQVRAQDFVLEAMKFANPIGQFDHNLDCLYDEIDNTKQYAKYDDEWDKMDAMARRYVAAGHPKNWGLWHCTVLARRHTPVVKSMCTQWFDELDAYCHQDQISYPFAMRNHGLKPEVFPYQVWSNEWLSHLGHNQGTLVRSPKRDLVIAQQIRPWETINIETRVERKYNWLT